MRTSNLRHPHLTVTALLLTVGGITQGQENLRLLPYPETPHHYALDWLGVPG